jgi:hypothetical protein
MFHANAMSGKPYSPGSCGGIKLCVSLEGKDFDMIRFASMGSEMIILYDKNKTGEIYPTTIASLYDRSRGTVNDAIVYLSKHPDYYRFTIRKTSKSTGWFTSERLESVYVLLPRYNIGEAFAPDYYFFEKEGKLRVWIKPIVRNGESDDNKLRKF